MRKILLVIITLFSLNAVAESLEVDRVRASILILTKKPNMKPRILHKILDGAVRAAKKYKVPLNVVLAIAWVESSYNINATNKRSNDYGIMQVNEWHIKRSKLDKIKLLTDYYYSFEQGVKIFKWFYDKYPLDEAIMRYNCGTKKSCIKWTKVQKYLDKVRRAW